MKKWLLFAVVCCGVSFSAVAFSDVEDLVRLANRVTRVVRDRGSMLTPREQAQVRRHLMSVLEVFKEIPGQPPAPPPQPIQGHYCSVACMDVNGAPDLRYSRGARGRFEVEARQLARENLARAHTCNRGIVDVACSPTYGTKENFYSLAACTDVNSNPDLRYFGLAVGQSVEESRQLSREELNRKHTCNRGINMWGTDTDWSGPFYCVVGCVDVNGNVDHRYTAGTSGASEVQATGLAIEELARKYTCNRGVKVDSCSQ